MERILSVEQMRQADEYTINNLGLSRDTLIARAGECVAEEIKKRLYGGRVLVCIGKGNNGEDGKVIARILSATHGFTVATLNVANGIFKMFDKKFDIIVDCIFGTGLNRPVEGKFKEAIDRINQSGAYVVSCDIASGLSGDTGRAMGIAVKANLTVAIQEYKLGHFINDGPDYSGEIIAKDIGISIWGDDYSKRLNDSDVSKLFLPRLKNVNKGTFKKACIFGGSKDFVGSTLLSENALIALKMGNGYSAMAIPESIFDAVSLTNPECIVFPMKDKDGKLVFIKEQIEKLMTYNSIAFGMGAGVSEENYKIIEFLLENYDGKLLIDADGLNSLSKFGLDILYKRKCEVVLTPHIGEFARLVNLDKTEVLANPIEIAKEFAKKYNVILLLKSATSVITNGDEVCLNCTGNNGMAKAGSGDVLSGFTAGLLAWDIDMFDAVCASAYLFGKSGEFALKDNNEYSLTASDIIRAIPQVINSL